MDISKPQILVKVKKASSYSKNDFKMHFLAQYHGTSLIFLQEIRYYARVIFLYDPKQKPEPNPVHGNALSLRADQINTNPSFQRACTHKAKILSFVFTQ